MLIRVNITNYDITSKYYTSEFKTTCSIEIVKETYINEMNLVNTITDFTKSKLYFFIDFRLVEPNKKILDFVSTDDNKLFIIALYDFDNNFSPFNTFIWISNIKIGNYYMFCPENMTIIDVKDKYNKYAESLNVITTKIIFVNSGRRVCDDDTIKKYSETSKHAVFVANFF